MTNTDNLSPNDRIRLHLEEIGTLLGNKLREIHQHPYTGTELEAWCTEVDESIDHSDENDVKIVMDCCHKKILDNTTDQEKRELYVAMIIEARKIIRKYKIDLGQSPISTTGMDYKVIGRFSKRAFTYYYDNTPLELSGQSGRLFDSFFNAPNNRLSVRQIEQLDDTFGKATTRVARLRRALRKTTNRDMIQSVNHGSQRGYKLLVE